MAGPDYELRTVSQRPKRQNTDTDGARDISIRSAVPSDTPSLLLLDIARPRLPERGRFIENAVSENTCFVAILDGTIVGYAVLEYTFYGYGFISMVMVSLDHRRQGVGQALLGHVENACATPKVFTSTNSSNLPMRGLLSKLGYTFCGLIRELDPDDAEWVYMKRTPQK